MCWLRGDGKDGKSVVAKVLARSLFEAGGVLDDERLRGSGARFAAASIWDKRLLTIPDTKIRDLVTIGLLHQLSGRDMIQVEMKGQTGFTAEPDVRILIGSNLRPVLTRRRSDTSRVLLIEVGPREDRSDPRFEGRLSAQLPAFLAACQKEYERLCPDHGDIDLEQAAVEALEMAVSEGEEDWEDLASALLERAPGSILSKRELQRLAGARCANNHDFSSFVEFLRTGWDVEERRAPVGGKRLRVLKGVRLRKAADRTGPLDNYSYNRNLHSSNNSSGPSGLRGQLIEETTELRDQTSPAPPGHLSGPQAPDATEDSR
jgi:hypothetical protein